ncbi:MAG: CBS domain-containing protein [Acidobacteriota bacterium]|nr:CBS domain-containing protein [Acidobacteriota bacterium]MDQ7087786.1 CBS domain-containing protein [Acidobacteriota bacterium]
MQIAGSVLATERSDPEQVFGLVRQLEQAAVEIIHYDHMDRAPLELSTVSRLRRMTGLPLEVHLVTRRPEQCLPLLAEAGVDYCAVQLETAEHFDLRRLRAFPGRLGLAVQTTTPIRRIEPLIHGVDYVLLMTTTPGRSGGRFDPAVFDRIRDFRLRHPRMPLHVDGGVDADVSSALRVLGVDVIVSGSFLFRGQSVIHRKMDLLRANADLGVEFFMMPEAAVPLVDRHAPVDEVVRSMARGRVGATLVLNSEGLLVGLITDGDLREALLRHSGDLDSLTASQIMNPRPLTLDRGQSLRQLVRAVESSGRPILVVPVTETESRRYAGCISLHNLLRLL